MIQHRQAPHRRRAPLLALRALAAAPHRYRRCGNSGVARDFARRQGFCEAQENWRVGRAQSPQDQEFRSRRPRPRARKNPRNHVVPGIFIWWQMRDSNPRRQCQLIYSQPPLAARVICRTSKEDHSQQQFRFRPRNREQDNLTELLPKNRIELLKPGNPRLPARPKPAGIRLRRGSGRPVSLRNELPVRR